MCSWSRVKAWRHGSTISGKTRPLLPFKKTWNILALWLCWAGRVLISITEWLIFVSSPVLLSHTYKIKLICWGSWLKSSHQWQLQVPLTQPNFALNPRWQPNSAAKCADKVFLGLSFYLPLNFRKECPPSPRIVSLEQRVLWIYCMFRPEISVATPPRGSKFERTVNSLDGKLQLHVKHCVIQSLAPLANLWNHYLSVFQSFLLHRMWTRETSPSNTPLLSERKWSGPVETVQKHQKHKAEAIQCVFWGPRL